MEEGSPNAGWSIFGYLISGMVFYGGVGWLVGHWTHHPLLFALADRNNLSLQLLRSFQQFDAIGDGITLLFEDDPRKNHQGEKH